MNTNGNVYTVIYTAIVVIVVAAALAFTAMTLAPKQDANVKAETLTQMMTAAGIETAAESNDAVLQKYSDEIAEAFVINLKGEKVRDLGTEKSGIELIDNLKPQNVAITKGGEPSLPVYIFKSGVTVIPCYGAGLWGPIWGYIALQPDLRTIAGAYFDHSSETPGLGAKIKDDPSFRAQFVGKKLDLDAAKAFSIVKGGAPEGAESAVDAITGATITSQKLGESINIWMAAYAEYLRNNVVAENVAETSTEE